MSVYGDCISLRAEYRDRLKRTVQFKPSSKHTGLGSTTYLMGKTKRIDFLNTQRHWLPKPSECQVLNTVNVAYFHDQKQVIHAIQNFAWGWKIFGRSNIPGSRMQRHHLVVIIGHCVGTAAVGGNDTRPDDSHQHFFPLLWQLQTMKEQKHDVMM